MPHLPLSKGPRRFCDFPESWCAVKVSRRISRLETAHILTQAHPEAEATAVQEGCLEGLPRTQDPFLSPCLGSRPDRVLGGGPWRGQDLELT